MYFFKNKDVDHLSTLLWEAISILEDFTKPLCDLEIRDQQERNMLYAITKARKEIELIEDYLMCYICTDSESGTKDENELLEEKKEDNEEIIPFQ